MCVLIALIILGCVHVCLRLLLALDCVRDASQRGPVHGQDVNYGGVFVGFCDSCVLYYDGSGS